MHWRAALTLPPRELFDAARREITRVRTRHSHTEQHAECRAAIRLVPNILFDLSAIAWRVCEWVTLLRPPGPARILRPARILSMVPYLQTEFTVSILAYLHLRRRAGSGGGGFESVTTGHARSPAYLACLIHSWVMARAAAPAHVRCKYRVLGPLASINRGRGRALPAWGSTPVALCRGTSTPSAPSWQAARRSAASSARRGGDLGSAACGFGLVVNGRVTLHVTVGNTSDRTP